VRKVTGIAAKMLRNSADIEDAVQDTFIEAFRDFHQLREPRYVERWLVGIVLHNAHRRFRKRAMMRRLGLDRSVDDEPLALQAGAAATQEVRAELALLDAVFDRMDIKDRMCAVLRYFEGYSLEEIAVSTQWSLATVKRRLAESKRQIVRHLEAKDHG
jgi:RNA polymerase sigma-70 factor (ECF subfamily)